MIQIHLEELKQIYQFDDATAFKVYVLEKATVNRVKEKNYTTVIDGEDLLSVHNDYYDQIFDSINNIY